MSVRFLQGDQLHWCEVVYKAKRKKSRWDIVATYQKRPTKTEKIFQFNEFLYLIATARSPRAAESPCAKFSCFQYCIFDVPSNSAASGIPLSFQSAVIRSRVGSVRLVKETEDPSRVCSVFPVSYQLR